MFKEFFNLLFWFPWLNFYSESIFLQFFILFFFFLFFNSINLYYMVINLFITIFLVSIFLSYYNLEVLTGFLLVVEFTAFFIIILFLLSINFENMTKNNIFLFIYFSFFIVLIYLLIFFFEFRIDNLNFLNSVNYWDDYYENFNNLIMNDIFGLYISYYFINSFIFYLFIILIFIASLICIILVKNSKVTLYNNTLSFNYVFNFFKDLMSFDFLRKQNMNYQNKRNSTTKLVKFKKLNVAKK